MLSGIWVPLKQQWVQREILKKYQKCFTSRRFCRFCSGWACGWGVSLGCFLSSALPHPFQTNLWCSSSLTGFFGAYPKWCSSTTPSVESWFWWDFFFRTPGGLSLAGWEQWSPLWRPSCSARTGRCTLSSLLSSLLRHRGWQVTMGNSDKITSFPEETTFNPQNSLYLFLVRGQGISYSLLLLISE